MKTISAISAPAVHQPVAIVPPPSTAAEAAASIPTPTQPTASKVPPERVFHSSIVRRIEAIMKQGKTVLNEKRSPPNPEEVAASQYSCRLPVTLDGVKVSATIDTGNTWRSAISDSLARRLGYDLQSLHPILESDIETAGADTKLSILGETPEPVFMRVRQLSAEIQPIVVKDLAADFNISGPMCALLGWTVEPAKGQIVCKSGFAFKLYPAVRQTIEEMRLKDCKSWAFEGPAAEPVYVAQATKILPFSVQRILLTAPNKTASPGTKILKSCRSFEQRFDVHPSKAALVELTDKLSTSTLVMNTQPHTISLPQGARFGTIVHGDTVTPTKDKRICSLEKVSAPHGPPRADVQLPPVDSMPHELVLDKNSAKEAEINNPAFLSEAEAALQAAKPEEREAAQQLLDERTAEFLSLLRRKEEN